MAVAQFHVEALVAQSHGPLEHLAMGDLLEVLLTRYYLSPDADFQAGSLEEAAEWAVEHLAEHLEEVADSAAEQAYSFLGY